MTLPETETLLLEQRDHELHITLNRPKTRNAMSLKMVKELMAVFESIQTQEGNHPVHLSNGLGSRRVG